MPFEEFIEHSATVEEHRFDIYGAAVPEAFRMLKLKDGWRWHWHPLWWTLVFGLLSALGIAGVLFLPALNAKPAWCAVGNAGYHPHLDVFLKSAVHHVRGAGVPAPGVDAANRRGNLSPAASRFVSSAGCGLLDGLNQSA